MKGLKAYTDIHGYFNKIDWATAASGDDQQRYAVLTYTGSTGQTFVIYDVERRKVYYQQQEGNETLEKVFAYFNETDIAFAEEDMVVYSLMEMRPSWSSLRRPTGRPPC